MFNNNCAIGFKGYITDVETGKKTLIPAKEDVERLKDLTAKVKNGADYDVTYINKNKRNMAVTIQAKDIQEGRQDVFVGKYGIRVHETVDRPKVWEAKLYSVYTPSLDKALKAAKSEFFKAVNVVQETLNK